MLEETQRSRTYPEPAGGAGSTHRPTSEEIAVSSAPPSGPETATPVQVREEPPSRFAGAASAYDDHPTATPPTAPVIRSRAVVVRVPVTEFGFRLRKLIWLSVGVVDAFLALDFLFRATAAVRDGFVAVVTQVGDALTSPFAGIFKGTAPSVGHTTDWSALLALAVYSVAAWLLVRVVIILTGPPPQGLV